MNIKEINTARSICIKECRISDSASEKRIVFHETCCESYKRSVGRCFNCPDAPDFQDPDEEIY